MESVDSDRSWMLHQRAVLHALFWFAIVLSILSDYSVMYNESKE